ncbi:MAG: insulinase family protein, partial [Eubacteriales bacterium]|nr:insulinase family protein [Eubacteriales bacterium]
ECTCLYAKVLDEHLPIAADVLSDLLRHSKFDPADIEKEKGVVCEEILMVEDTPEDLVHEALSSIVHGSSAYAKPILGTEASVRSFTREGIVDYMDRHYVPDNIVVSCAGNFEREALLDAVNRCFSGDAASFNKPGPACEITDKRAFKALEKDVEQVHICLGFPGYKNDDDRQYPLFVLNNALGGSMSSRLFQNIREERGLAYSIYSYPSAYADAGYFALYAGTGEKQAEEVVKLMLLELDELLKNGITAEEFKRSKEQLKGSYMLGQESTSARSNAIGKAELLRGKVYTEQEIMERIERVTMDDVRAILPYVFDRNRICGAFVGRMSEREKDIEKRIMEW